MKKITLIIIVVILLPIITLTGMILWPVADFPAPMQSINKPFSKVNFAEAPPVSALKARDGIEIAYRKYHAEDEQVVALLLHGSSAHGLSMHPLAKALSETQITAYTIDIRGHGKTGNRGDVHHVNQPSEDVADFIDFLKNEHINTPVSLLGFSSGGGLALNATGLEFVNKNIQRLILVSPMLGARQKPTTAHNPYKTDEKWAYPDIPRIIGLNILNRLRIHYFDNLPVITFATADMPQLTPRYSHRLLASLTPQDAQILLSRVKAPLSLIVGEKDEIFFAPTYKDVVLPSKPHARITIVPNLNHIDMILKNPGFEVIISEMKQGG